MYTNRHLTLLICFCISIAISAQKKPKKELYVPMDYSTCGYHASGKVIPDVRVAVYVAWQEGDCAPLIQQAIDQVAAQKADDSGHRGAVLLGEGTFHLSQPLRIQASGIVLRGMGKGKTTLHKQGVERGAIIYIEGTEGKEPPVIKRKSNTVREISVQDTLWLSDDKV